AGGLARAILRKTRVVRVQKDGRRIQYQHARGMVLADRPNDRLDNFAESPRVNGREPVEQFSIPPARGVSFDVGGREVEDMRIARGRQSLAGRDGQGT